MYFFYLFIYFFFFFNFFIYYFFFFFALFYRHVSIHSLKYVIFNKKEISLPYLTFTTLWTYSADEKIGYIFLRGLFYLQLLRKKLDENQLQDVMIVAADDFQAEFETNLARDMLLDPELSSAVDVFGYVFL